MSDYHNKRTREILSAVQYAVVATASAGGKPWNSPVSGLWDKDLNLYWFSDKDSVHSRNIRENEKVFIVVYDSTMKVGTGEGVYIEATAYEVNDPIEVRHVIELQNSDIRRDYQQVTANAIHRFYKASPIHIWVNDKEKDANGNYVKDIRVKVSID